jgi:hypothetical protein
MATEVDIANLALAHLGDSATVASLDPPEGSAQAELCAIFYPIARNALLESHNWKFSIRRVTLAALSVDSYEWAFAYAAPSDAIRLLSVLPPGASATDSSQPYDTESAPGGENIILTNQESAVLRYTAFVSDTSKFTPLVVEALSMLLASYLAGPILKGDVGKAEAKACYTLYRTILAQASASDANQRKVSPTHTPAWIGGR